MPVNVETSQSAKEISRNLNNISTDFTSLICTSGLCLVMIGLH